MPEAFGIAVISDIGVSMRRFRLRRDCSSESQRAAGGEKSFRDLPV
jgi:hypothetical protein